jgi:hypothetical protein
MSYAWKSIHYAYLFQRRHVARVILSLFVVLVILLATSSAFPSAILTQFRLYVYFTNIIKHSSFPEIPPHSLCVNPLRMYKLISYKASI